MVRVQLLGDTRKFEPKLVGRFNKREIICIFCAIPVFFLFFLLFFFVKNILVHVLLALIPCIPVIMCGRMHIAGIRPEKLIAKTFYRTIFTPKVRTRKNENEIKKLLKAEIEKDEKQKKETVEKKGKVKIKKTQIDYGTSVKYYE